MPTKKKTVEELENNTQGSSEEQLKKKQKEYEKKIKRDVKLGIGQIDFEKIDFDRLEDSDGLVEELEPYLNEAMEKAMVHPEYENLAILVCSFNHTDGETSVTAPMFICYQYPDDQFDFTFDIVAAKAIIHNGFKIWCIKHFFEMGCGYVPYEVAAKLLKDIREQEEQAEETEKAKAADMAINAILKKKTTKNE